AAGGSGVVRGQEAFVVPVDGGGERVAEPAPGLAPFPLVAVRVAQGHTEARGERFDGGLEVEVLDLTDEADDIAADLAAEAVVDALHLVDGERRGLLTVERAEAHPVLAAAP